MARYAPTLLIVVRTIYQVDTQSVMQPNPPATCDLDKLTVEQLERLSRKRREAVEETESQMIKRIKRIDQESEVAKEIVRALEEEEEEVKRIELLMEDLRKSREEAKAKRVDRIAVAKVCVWLIY